MTRTSLQQVRKNPKDSEGCGRMHVEEQDVSDVTCTVKSARGVG